jgi:hypothetical protein
MIMFGSFLPNLLVGFVQRHRTYCRSPVENIPLQAERHSGPTQKLFAFPPESVFAFRPECCSDSQRNAVRLQTGIAFAFDPDSPLKNPVNAPMSRNGWFCSFGGFVFNAE